MIYQEISKYKKVAKHWWHGEIFRFGIAGMIAVAIHYVVYLLAALWINATLAYIVGYLVSFIANFYLSSFFTFRTRPTWKKGVGFIVCHLLNFSVQLALFHIFLWFKVPPHILPLCVFSLAVPLNFLMVRWVMKGKRL